MSVHRAADGKKDIYLHSHSHSHTHNLHPGVNWLPNDNIPYLLLYFRHHLSLHLVYALLSRRQVFFHHTACQVLPVSL